MEQIFKIGDKVYLYPLGWGDIKSKSDYDYSVYFESISDTRYIGGDVRGLLSFTEYTLEGFSQERPEELPNRGDVVWVRDDDDDDWVISHFMDYKIDKTFPYGTSIDMTNGSRATWRQMTTKYPYANEHN